MIAGEEASPACGESDWVCYTFENWRFRIYCAMCGHSTKPHPNLKTARIEWLGRREQPSV
jgi:hypothetical protein